MRLLLDENVPRPLHQVLTTFIVIHEIVHLLDLDGWSGTRDERLYPRAAAVGFHAVLTNDGRQMQRPREVAAIAESGFPKSSTHTSTLVWSASGSRSPQSPQGCPAHWRCWKEPTAKG